MDITAPEAPSPQIRDEAVKMNEDSIMSETTNKNFFENPMGGGTALGAGVGGLIGAALGNGNGLFGGNGNRETATLDQVDSRFNALQGQLSADQVQDRIAGVQAAIGGLNHTVGVAVGGATAALSLELGSLKDAVQAASSVNQLALCNLGHSVTSGIASVNQNILLQGAASRELALQQEVNRARDHATELRIELSETKNQAGHTATQVLMQQIISAK